MSSRFASLHSGLLIRDRAPAPPPVVMPAMRPEPEPAAGLSWQSPRSAVIRPFPFTPAAAPTPAPLPVAQPEAAAAPSADCARRRSFTLRLDERQHLLLQIAKKRFGLSGQRILLRALEALLGRSG